MLGEIEKRGMFNMQYRMILDGEPKYVTLQAALVEAADPEGGSGRKRSSGVP